MGELDSSMTTPQQFLEIIKPKLLDGLEAYVDEHNNVVVKGKKLAFCHTDLELEDLPISEVLKRFEINQSLVWEKEAKG